MNQLQQTYHDKLAPALKEELKLKNLLAVPKLLKVTLNTSSKDFIGNDELLAKTKDWLAIVTGQVPHPTKAKKSIATFNLRQGDIVGLSVTLRGQRMYDFVQRLINIVLPRTKDFQGISLTSFDGRGGYSLGLPEQIIFPEVEYDKIGRIQGLEIAFNTSAKNKDQTKALLSALGMPFAKEDQK